MKAFTTIDEYIAAAPTNAQTRLRELRRTIRKAAPRAQETIRYRIPTFRLNGNLVHFGAFKNHISFFPTASGVDAFKNELTDFKH